MWDQTIKDRAAELRQRGYSYADILDELGIPKSTLSAWLKGVDFSEIVKTQNINQAKRIWGNTLKEYNKKRHLEFLEHTEILMQRCAEDIGQLSQRDMFILFMGLYWGEGGKRDPASIRITNCDPRLIMACLRYLRKCSSVKEERLRGEIHIHPNIEATPAKDYWSRLTAIPLIRLRCYTVVSSASKGKKPKNTLLYGTFCLIIQDAYYAKQVKGWFRGLANNFSMPV